MTPKRTLYVGPFVHSKSLQDLEICQEGIIGVDEHGKIAFIERVGNDAGAAAGKHGWSTYEIVRIRDNGFFFPGFIGTYTLRPKFFKLVFAQVTRDYSNNALDTHIHASQYPNAGIFGKSTLLDWLNTYTFPLESSLHDTTRASHVYSRVVSRTLSHGTTTAAYYATIHVPATNLLADICKARGQRAFVGRVCMNMMSPEYYRDESVELAVQRSRESIEYIRGIDPSHELITPIITPRFAPSCSIDCLKSLGDLHRETGVPVQTHISENLKEVELVHKLFPQCSSYADVYDSSGLLTAKMILAHAVHLSEDERKLIKARNSKISHCPASNTALTSGCTKVRQLINEGIYVGLGTDVSGGFSPSILEMVRHAIWVSRYVAMSDGDAAKLSTEEALHLATLGGAHVVGLQDKIGNFEVGKEWDAQMISLGQVEVGSEAHEEHEGPVDVFGWESWEDRVNKWVYNGDDRNTVAVWVKGRRVHSTTRYQP